MCVQHIYCNTTVHALAVLKRGCDARCFTSKIEKAWRGDSVCRALGNMISIHINNAIALSILPKLKSPFVLLPAATPWKKKSGMLWCTPV